MLPALIHWRKFTFKTRPRFVATALGVAVLVVSNVLVARSAAAPEERRDVDDDEPVAQERRSNEQLVAEGQRIFRFDTFGDEQQWTDQLRMHEVIETLPPTTALSLGLKVDVDALPQAVRDALALGQVDLTDPAVTVTLIELNAVVGVAGTVETINNEKRLTRVGITCALCHSTVDDSFAPSIGHRLDGWPNLDLNPGAIIAASPAVPPEVKAVYNSWGPGMYDPRFNQDGQSTPVVIPPAYGLEGVKRATYTGDGSITYWNRYVSVTQMGGMGSFHDGRIGVHVERKPDQVKDKLKPLRAYQHSLATPTAPAGSFDAAAAQRGQTIFRGQAKCATCHRGVHYTDSNRGARHQPAETGMDPAYALRSATKKYRTTPLRGLATHAPYFHDGSAETLEDVVEHYDAFLNLRLSPDQKIDLVEYLKSL
jgi:hypothetical protein